MSRDKVIGIVPYDINLFTEEEEMFSEINDSTCVANIILLDTMGVFKSLHVIDSIQYSLFATIRA